MARSLGGIQTVAGFSDNEAISWLIARLPNSVEDWERARKTVRDGLRNGRLNPIELPDRPSPKASPRDSIVFPEEDDEWPGPDPEEMRRQESRGDLVEDDLLDTIDPRFWTEPAPPRQWVIQDWLPRGYVTLLMGDGGTGKSLLAMQLMTSLATGIPWVGMDVKKGRAFGFMCEDDVLELQRRQEAINLAYNIDRSALDDLRFAARYGFDNLLMTFDGKDRGCLTQLALKLERTLDSFAPDLVVLDTLADVFGGDEVRRSHARQFVQNVGGRLARKFDCSVVICGHP